MSRLTAFLRAINVGKRRVKMDVLRGHFEDLGLTDVTSFIASGNVSFEAPGGPTAALERTIEQHLQASLGYTVATFVRSQDELTAIAALDDWTEQEGHTLSVGFVHAEHPADVLAKHISSESDLLVRGRELYWYSRVSTHKSKLSGAKLERTLGAPSTWRRLRTIQRMIAR
jgi:uncharacterized protein (DUF1697 family)